MERQIETSTTIPVAVGRARNILIDNPCTLFSDDTTDRSRSSPCRLDLYITVGAGASVHQQVEVQLDIPRSNETGLVVPLSWRATGHKRLLPTFDGELELAADRVGSSLTLRGAYSVPLGAVGWLADHVMGRPLARRSLAETVEQLGQRLEAEVQKRVRDPRSRPLESYRVSPARSEMYVG